MTSFKFHPKNCAACGSCASQERVRAVALHSAEVPRGSAAPGAYCLVLYEHTRVHGHCNSCRITASVFCLFQNEDGLIMWWDTVEGLFAHVFPFT